MAEPKLTPMMKQYRQIKAEIPDDAILSGWGIFMNCFLMTPSGPPPSWMWS